MAPCAVQDDPAPAPGSTLPALVQAIAFRLAESLDANNPPDQIDRQLARTYWRDMTAEFGREAAEERTNLCPTR